MTLLESPSEAEWTARLLESWQESGGQALAQRGAFHAVLAGGTTPLPFYRALARLSWPWSATQLFIGDERCVPPDHKDCHFRAIHTAFYPIKPNLHRWRTELGDYARAALEYEHLLKRETGDPPRPDLVVLNLAGDSPFGFYAEGPRATTLLDAPQLRGKRLAVTLPVIQHARSVWILSRGTALAAQARALASGTPSAVACEAAPPVIHHCLA